MTQIIKNTIQDFLVFILTPKYIKLKLKIINETVGNLSYSKTEREILSDMITLVQAYYSLSRAYKEHRCFHLSSENQDALAKHYLQLSNKWRKTLNTKIDNEKKELSNVS